MILNHHIQGASLLMVQEHNKKPKTAAFESSKINFESRCLIVYFFGGEHKDFKTSANPFLQINFNCPGNSCLLWLQIHELWA